MLVDATGQERHISFSQGDPLVLRLVNIVDDVILDVCGGDISPMRPVCGAILSIGVVDSQRLVLGTG
jgi:hypothetical protein